MESILNANKAWIDETWDKMVEKLQSEGVESTPYEDKTW